MPYVAPAHPDWVLNEVNELPFDTQTLIFFIFVSLVPSFENSIIIVLSRLLASTETVAAAASGAGRTTKRLTTANNMITKFILEYFFIGFIIFSVIKL